MDKAMGDIKDFKNLQTKKVLYYYSSTKTKTIHELIMITTPAKNKVEFKVLNNKVVVSNETDLETAIDVYNNLK